MFKEVLIGVLSLALIAVLVVLFIGDKPEDKQWIFDSFAEAYPNVTRTITAFEVESFYFEYIEDGTLRKALYIGIMADKWQDLN